MICRAVRPFRLESGRCASARPAIPIRPEPLQYRIGPKLANYRSETPQKRWREILVVPSSMPLTFSRSRQSGRVGTGKSAPQRRFALCHFGYLRGLRSAPCFKLNTKCFHESSLVILKLNQLECLRDELGNHVRPEMRIIVSHDMANERREMST
jgi:hypothetical protein